MPGLEVPLLSPDGIAAVCAGEVLRGGEPASSVVTDSREPCEGQCFFALRGEHHDGHAHVEGALRGGAVGAVVESMPGGRIPGNRFIVRVQDTGRSLLELAGHYRRNHDLKVVGITGSCGKTSTKDMLGQVLAAAMPTVSSPRSYNNQVGVPLTLFGIRPETRAAVVEIGSNAPGEVAALSAVAEPDVAIVTCVGQAHLAGLGSLKGVAKEKSGVVEALPEEGLAILNGDDVACREMANATSARTAMVRIDAEADWFATDLRFQGLGTSFLLRGSRRVILPRLGSHNVYNALFTLAAATELGVHEDLVLMELARSQPTQRRMEYRCAAGVTVFDDTYNMNPQSSRVALEAVAELDGGRRIVVFGEMLELGDRAEALHRALGSQVAETGMDLLICVGRGASAIAEGALSSAMDPAMVHCVSGVGEARELLRGLLSPGDVVLCKASRRVALDRLVDAVLTDLELAQPDLAERAGVPR